MITGDLPADRVERTEHVSLGRFTLALARTVIPAAAVFSVAVGIALSAILLGIMVAMEAKPPLWVAASLVGFFGIFHGYAHGTELPAGENALLYSVGFVIATGCLHGIGVALGLFHKLPAGKWLLRMAGTFISVMGMFFLWRALT